MDYVTFTPTGTDKPCGTYKLRTSATIDDLCRLIGQHMRCPFTLLVDGMLIDPTDQHHRLQCSLSSLDLSTEYSYPISVNRKSPPRVQVFFQIGRAHV